MTLEPLLTAPPAVQLHVATVLPAFAIGTWQIFVSRKGAPLHRALGYLFLALISIAAISAIFIHQLMPSAPFGFSPIHLLVIVTLLGIAGALRGAWTHNVRMHSRSMIAVYVGGLVIAGTLAFLPGRIMHRVVLGG
jgi:uncharacterized membrane protein